MTSVLGAVPAALTCLRAALGPALLVAAYVSPNNRVLMAVCLVVAFVSDILDGVIARRLGIATPTLRRFDSVADSIFYVCALAAVWIRHPGVLTENLSILIVLVILECTRYGFDLWKFGREASYHMWSSKVWGVALFAAFYAVLVHGHGGRVAAMAILVGIVADLEGLLISCTLRSWHHDVPTIVHAIKIRATEQLSERRAAADA